MWEQNRSEGCIGECYKYEEAVEICHEYLLNIEAIGLLKRVCTKGTNANVKILIGVVIVNRDLVCQAHKYVLNNTDVIQAHINKHIEYIRCINLTNLRREKRIIDEQNKTFINCFRNWVATTKSNYISETLRW